MAKNLAPGKREVDELKGLVGEVEGWLTNRVGEANYGLTSTCADKGVIVEISSCGQTEEQIRPLLEESV